MHHLEDELKRGIDTGLHLGAQAFASIEGEPLLDLTVGERVPGESLGHDDLMIWMSAGKPLLAVALGRLVARSQATWEDAVAQHWPAFASGGKQNITLKQLLTHTSGITEVNLLDAIDWDDAVARVGAAPLMSGVESGGRAAYSPLAGWTALGAVVQRLAAAAATQEHGRAVEPLGEVLRREVIEVAGIEDLCAPLSDQDVAAHGHRLSGMFNTMRRPGASAAPPWPSVKGYSAAESTIARPGSNTRGSARAMARFYNTLLTDLEGDDAPVLLAPPQIQRMVQPERIGRFDETFQYVMDFGLGFLLNPQRNDAAAPPFTAPYTYGPHVSRDAFGHGGSQSTVAFADPQTHLVVAIASNGMPGEPRHQQRLRRWLEALHQDLEM